MEKLGIILMLAAAISGHKTANDSESVADSMSRLRIDLFKDYDKLIIPIKNIDKPVEMTFGLALIDMDTQNDGTVDLEVWLRFVWNDYRLEWDEIDYNGISVLRLPAENLWLPDVKLYNQLGLSGEEGKLIGGDFNVLIYPNGEVLAVPSAKVKISCFNESSFGLQKDWPWGKHMCHLKFGSWTYDGFQIDLNMYNSVEGTNVVESGVDMSDFRAGPVRILNNTLVRNEKFYTCCDEPYLDITVSLAIQQLYRVEKDGTITENPFIPVGELKHPDYRTMSPMDSTGFPGGSIAVG